MTLVALPIGVLLGGVYFGALWWSLAPERRWRRPGLVLLIGWLLRSALALAVFASLLRAAGPLALLLTLAGFLLARGAWLRRASNPSGGSA